MTWKYQNKLLWIVPVSLLLSLSSCLKDNCTRTYRLYTPVYKTLTAVRQEMKSGAAKTLEKPGKLYIYGNYIFLNEQEKGIHIIDNSNPASPKNIAFINIPGNVDLAVKGNTLYADSWMDLVSFDISNPQQVIAKNFVNSVFPHRNGYYRYATNYRPAPNAPLDPDSINVIVDWTTRDTTVSCETYNYLYERFYASASADASGSFASQQVGGGQGGSMARFTLMDNYLYTVTNAALNTFDISTPLQPSLVGKSQIGWDIETIYPFKNQLFIGSSSGMFIYDVSNPGTPSKKGSFSHVRSCDPVVANDTYAYVTLRSGTMCQGFTNQLEVLDVRNLNNPGLVKTYPMTNPHGLAIDGNTLFICDGKDGLKVYDAANANELKLIRQIGDFETYDIIAYNKWALVVAKDGLYQFDYTNLNNIKQISKISLDKH
ncbi:MAG: hypothetical protein J7621_20985 [Niastella sp.]|nr:hypothetical protein [Niastella sp.]